jgi:hypothetical protein
MTRETLIDIIRAELERQAKLKRFKLSPGGWPDYVKIDGMLDVHALAEAIVNR